MLRQLAYLETLQEAQRGRENIGSRHQSSLFFRADRHCRRLVIWIGKAERIALKQRPSVSPADGEDDRLKELWERWGVRKRGRLRFSMASKSPSSIQLSKVLDGRWFPRCSVQTSSPCIELPFAWCWHIRSRHAPRGILCLWKQTTQEAYARQPDLDQVAHKLAALSLGNGGDFCLGRDHHL